ncbi:hypothetical protein [Streptomyces alboflavus]|uniref:hypothetical protein n=1 Tax=Streptomyces alboflavus TaxID=67267 RepID=UPI000F6574D8|nr:hypothetical protein [Streptomyces alboflavus]
MGERLTRTELKERAQDAIMDALSITWHKHWSMENDIPDEQRDEFNEMIQREVNRVARLFGYEEVKRG